MRSALVKADELGCKSIALPAISSGIYGFPKPLCAETFFKVLESYACERETSLEDVRLTNFDTETVDIFQSEFDKFFEV